MKRTLGRKMELMLKKKSAKGRKMELMLKKKSAKGGNEKEKERLKRERAIEEGSHAHTLKLNH